MLRPAPITLHYTTFHINDNITLVKNIGAMGKEDNKTKLENLSLSMCKGKLENVHTFANCSKCRGLGCKKDKSNYI